MEDFALSNAVPSRLFQSVLPVPHILEVVQDAQIRSQREPKTHQRISGKDIRGYLIGSKKPTGCIDLIIFIRSLREHRYKMDY